MAGRVLLAKIEDAGGQVRSVARRFALVAVAGELATKAGITGWPQGEAMRAAQVMFSAWPKERGTTGASKDERAKSAASVKPPGPGGEGVRLYAVPANVIDYGTEAD